MIGIITGSGIYNLNNLVINEKKNIYSIYGSSSVTLGKIGEKDVAFIARHGENHDLLPNMINYRANIMALKILGANAIISTSVMGLTDPNIDLATTIIFDDLFFIDNRLPDGSLCTLFTQAAQKERAHYIFSSPYAKRLREIAADAAKKLKIKYKDSGVYAHVNGPRFNSKSEIRYLQSIGISAISQTCGPEVILSGEAEIPHLLIGFGVDYANGVKDEPTPIEVLDKNLKQASVIIPALIEEIVEKVNYYDLSFDGFLYKFD